MTAAQAEPSPTGSQTLERGLAVLVEISRHPDGLTTSQVAAACDLHRSIANRLLVSLLRTGFVTRDEAGRYTVGRAAEQLSRHAGPPVLRTIAEPVLRRLAVRLDATASLVEVVDGAAVTTVVAESMSHGPRFTYRLGNRDPLDRGAGGIAALASGPAVDGEDPRVAETRRRGFVTTHAELNPGAYGIAAPLPGWPVLAAINIVTSHHDLCTSGIDPLVRAAAEVGSAP